MFEEFDNPDDKIPYTELMADIEAQCIEYTQAFYRYYTLTVRPTFKMFKGKKSCLQEVIDNILKDCNGLLQAIRFEKEGTPNLHAHILLKCPYIKDKAKHRQVGYHTHFDLIKKKGQEESIVNWTKYTDKEHNDGDLYEEKYGNMFEEV